MADGETRRVGIERLVENQMNRWNVEARLRHSESDDSTVEEGIKPYIAISRLRGSHGNELGRILAERLGVQLYDRELVDYVAERANVRAEAVAALGETCTTRPTTGSPGPSTNGSSVR